MRRRISDVPAGIHFSKITVRFVPIPPGTGFCVPTADFFADISSATALALHGFSFRGSGAALGLIGVFCAGTFVFALARVRRRIAGARTAVGRAFAWIGSGIAGAHAAVGRAFTRIG